MAKPAWKILKEHGVKSPKVVVEEAKHAGLALSDAVAMLEKETGIPQENIFGCDYGPRSGPPFCHQPVTEARVRSLLAQNLNNGVGWTQLTYRPFVEEAQRLGGAHKPRFQMRVGFKILAGLIRQYGQANGFAHYNGVGPAAAAYGRDAAAKAARWKQILNP